MLFFKIRIQNLFISSFAYSNIHKNLTYIMDKQENSTVSLITGQGTLIQEPEQQEDKKTLLDRYFGHMSEGSLRGSIFALLASAMGTGVFNLPLRTYQIGVLPFALFIFLGGFFSWIGMVLMIRLIMQRKFKSYSEMSEAAFGNKLKRLSQFCIIVYPWGITICFQVIFAKFVCQLLKDQLDLDLYENRQKEVYNTTGTWVRIAANLVCFGFGLIFALKKNISLLQKIAIVGVISVIFNISTVVIISLVGFTTDTGIRYRGIFHVDWSKVSLLTPTDNGDWQAFSVLAQGIASILFCYVNHQMLFPLSVSLKRPTKKRFSKIINRVHIVQFLAYFIIGVAAYLLLLEHIEDRQIAPVVIASIPTKIVMVGKILMLAALFFAVPLNMFPARQSLIQAFNIQRTNKNHVIVTVCMMVSSTAIAISFISVNSYFGLLGGTAGVLMAGGIPALCYFKLAEKISKFDIFLLVICVLTTLLASFGAILSILPSSS